MRSPVWLIACLFLLTACIPSAQSSPSASFAPNPPTPTSTLPAAGQGAPTKAVALFDGQRAYRDVLAQMAIGPRPTGSPADRATGDHILAELKRAGWSAETQEFEFRATPIRNIIAKAGQGPLVLVGAHYDTRSRADQDKAHPDQPVPGANDGASGVAVLLELARVLDPATLKQQVWLVFFDAEDQGEIDGWPWSVGAVHVAENLTLKPDAVIVLDMVGDSDQNFYFEINSDKALQKELFGIAAGLGYGGQFIAQPRWTMIDDHTPFLQRGIRAVDLIDFDYPYWHTLGDTADKVSAASLERVGRVVQAWLQQK